MGQLRDRMIEDLRLRGRAQNTIDTYVRCVRKLVEWAGVAPIKIDATIVCAFLLYLMDERRLSAASHGVGALRTLCPHPILLLRSLQPRKHGARRVGFLEP